jgi:hypothetical protein
MATTLTATALRRELAARALHHARLHPHESTHGTLPSILFQPYRDHDLEALHGNFHPASYRAILANPAWSARLAKTYTAARGIPHRHHPDRDRTRRELDCAVSSDALLMNIFCHPNILTRPALLALLGLGSSETPQPIFGYRPHLPLPPGRRSKPLTDRTEIDLHLGPLLIEAKLTETSFQRAPLSAVQRYPAFTGLFDPEDLPIEDPGKLSTYPQTGPTPDPALPTEPSDDMHWRPEPDLPPNLPTPSRLARHPILHSYQLVRGVLAAHHENKSFVVLCDRRRSDLIERWFQILRAIRPADLRSRCALLTWQELSATLPTPLQDFLSNKYGILPT